MNFHRTAGALALGVSAMLIAPLTVAQEEEVIEEVVAVGIRNSLAAAIDVKRSDGRIVDAVVAEDIGKLPDNNIAEALQRITGVSLDSDFGVGESISIRGMSGNRVEINGRTTLGDDRDGISLQDFPSAFLKSVEVVKSPTADMIEGALGGTVGMKTIRPLDLRDTTIAASFDYEYADKAEEWAPIFNVSAGDVWDLDNGSSIGVIGMLSYQDRTIRQDEFKNRVRLYDEDVNGLTANTPSGRFAVREQNTLEQYLQHRERTSLNLSVQWAPASQRGNVYLDVARTERDGGEEGNSTLDVGGSRTYNANTTQDRNGQVNDYSLTGAFVIPKTWSDFRSTETTSNALGFDFDVSDTITISGEFAVATSDSSEPSSEFNLRPVDKANWETWAAQYTQGVSDYDDDRVAFGLRHTFDAGIVQSGDNVPSIVYSDPQGLLNPQTLAFRALRYDDDSTENDETAIRFDVDFAEAFGIEGLALKAGVRTTKNDYTFDRLRFRSGDNRYKDTFIDEGLATEQPVTYWVDDMDALCGGCFTVVNHPNTFSQHGGSGQFDLGQYLIYSPSRLSNNPGATWDLYAQMMAGTNNAVTGSLRDNLVRQESSFRDITEETTAFYLSAELDFDRVRAIIGGRFVQTDIKSAAFADGVLEKGSHDYSDFLPSMNISFDLTDETILRLATARVMRRANYDDLSPAFVIEGGFSTAEQGAFDLDPYRATQYDLSLEHYFSDSNLVSFAVFYKDVASFLTEAVSCRASAETAQQQVTEWENICLLNSAGVDNPNIVTSTLEDFSGEPDPDAAGSAFTLAQRDLGLTGIRTNQNVNGEDGSVKGFELGYQQHFDFLPGAWSGMGVSANYTYAKSEQPNGNSLLGISENSYNAQVYWEDEIWQVRLAYNYRDEFLSTEEETRIANVGALALNSATNEVTDPNFDPTAGNNYRDARGQLDFSASWAVRDNITVVANVVNLTNEPTLFITELGSPWKYDEADRRFSIGLRAKF